MNDSHLFSIQNEYLVEISPDRSERGKIMLRVLFIPAAFVVGRIEIPGAV
jgi:hypothetical protein